MFRPPYLNLGPRALKEYNEHQAFFDRMFRQLKKENKLNPDYRATREELERITLYFDACRSAFGIFDSLLRDLSLLKRFLIDNKKYGFNEGLLMLNFQSILSYLILSTYASIENMLITMLKGAKYGPKKEEQVIGTETLKSLLDKIGRLYPAHKIPRDIIDIPFRNSLAHGWYRTENNTFVYFEDALFTKRKNLTIKELLRKQMRLNVLGMALGFLVIGADY